MKIEFWYFIIGELPILVIPCSYGLQVSGGPCFEFYLLSQISPPLKCVYTHNKPTYILVTLDICMKKYILLFVQIGQLVSITHHSSTTDFRIELIFNWIRILTVVTKNHTTLFASRVYRFQRIDFFYNVNLTLINS